MRHGVCSCAGDAVQRLRPYAGAYLVHLVATFPCADAAESHAHIAEQEGERRECEDSRKRRHGRPVRQPRRHRAPRARSEVARVRRANCVIWHVYPGDTDAGKHVHTRGRARAHTHTHTHTHSTCTMPARPRATGNTSKKIFCVFLIDVHVVYVFALNALLLACKLSFRELVGVHICAHIATRRDTDSRPRLC